MQKVEKNLPKATAEIVREYDELQQKLNGLDPSWSDEEVNVASERLCELENSYDWFNVEFTDPATGKKGLKTVSGEVIAPALYDGFNEFHSYVFAPHAPVIAMKDGKCGMTVQVSSSAISSSTPSSLIHSAHSMSLVGTAIRSALVSLLPTAR